MLIQGNALRLPLADESVHMVVTSPPYWALRDYGTAMWVGGEAGCNHSQKRRAGGGSSTLTGSQAGNNHDQEPFRDVCGKCGALRVDNQLGLEATPEEYVANMVAVFREVRRVLRPDGVCWLNLGDSYASAWAVNRRSTIGADAPSLDERSNRLSGALKEKDLVGIPWRVAFALQADGWWLRSDVVWYKPNPMPESVRGWRWERHRIKVENSKHATEHDIRGGHKKMLEDASVHQGMNPEFLAVWVNCPGCEKCAANDGYVLRKASWRPTKAHEYVFMLSKSGDYYCDDEAVAEEVSQNTHARISQDLANQVGSFKANGGNKTNGPMKAVFRDSTRKLSEEGSGIKSNRSMEAALSLQVSKRNRRTVWKVNNDLGEFMRYCEGQGVDLDSLMSAFINGQDEQKSVWDIATFSYRGAHFATYPPGLVEPCVKAGTSERGCCPACGAPWVRMVMKGFSDHDGETDSAYQEGTTANRLALLRQAARREGGEYQNKSVTLGWRPSCNCDAGEPVPALVLDPFNGAGTTGLVCQQLGRRYVGVDLKWEYLQMSRERLGHAALEAWEEGKALDGGEGLEGLPLFT